MHQEKLDRQAELGGSAELSKVASVQESLSACSWVRILAWPCLEHCLTDVVVWVEKVIPRLRAPTQDLGSDGGSRPDV